MRYAIGVLDDSFSDMSSMRCADNTALLAASAQANMADVNADSAPFAKARAPLLSLDEVPHKRHVAPPVLSTYNPLVPDPGTPAFATREDQFAAGTASQLKRTEEARRQQKKVDTLLQ